MFSHPNLKNGKTNDYCFGMDIESKRDQQLTNRIKPKWRIYEISEKSKRLYLNGISHGDRDIGNSGCGSRS